MISPVTGSKNVTLEREIPVSYLLHNYREVVGLDVSRFFEGSDTISIYECRDTGYRFYAPNGLMGDDQFYDEISRNDWYYIPWKWEHEACLRFFRPGMEVLEVGSGRGGFIEGLNSRIEGLSVTGLELNSDAIREATEKGMNMIGEPIQRHAEAHPDKYDVVCSFQVVEHLADVKEIIDAMIKALRPGGTLLISVPNNDGFIGKNPHKSNVLNMPPHHVGLWSRKSLTSLADYFPMDLKEVILEPLQYIHAGVYQHTMLGNRFGMNSLITKLYWKLRINKLIQPWLLRRADKIVGHSIIAVYTKREGNENT